jgi:hypothetical protein
MTDVRAEETGARVDASADQEVEVTRGAAGMPEPPAEPSENPSLDDLEEAMRDVVDPSWASTWLISAWSMTSGWMTGSRCWT